MLNIRKSIFETNSSSMHSIIISQNPINNTDYFSYDWDYFHILKFSDKDFTWNSNTPEVLDTFEKKIAYFIVSMFDTYSGDEKRLFKKLVKIVKEILKENNITTYDNIEISLPKHYKWDMTQNKYINEKVEYYGNLEYECRGMLKDFLNKYNLSYKQFLENPNICVIIDTAHYCLFYDTLINGDIDKNAIEIYPESHYKEIYED